MQSSLWPMRWETHFEDNIYIFISLKGNYLNSSSNLKHQKNSKNPKKLTIDKKKSQICHVNCQLSSTPRTTDPPLLTPQLCTIGWFAKTDIFVLCSSLPRALKPVIPQTESSLHAVSPSRLRMLSPWEETS